MFLSALGEYERIAGSTSRFTPSERAVLDDVDVDDAPRLRAEVGDVSIEPEDRDLEGDGRDLDGARRVGRTGGEADLRLCEVRNGIENGDPRGLLAVAFREWDASELDVGARIVARGHLERRLTLEPHRGASFRPERHRRSNEQLLGALAGIAPARTITVRSFEIDARDLAGLV